MTEQTQRTQPLADRTPAEVEAFLHQQQAAYETLKERGLRLDLTRGKPSTAQLDLSERLLSLPTGVKDSAGVDTRNYGGLQGISELRSMFADLLWVEPGDQRHHEYDEDHDHEEVRHQLLLGGPHDLAELGDHLAVEGGRTRALAIVTARFLTRLVPSRGVRHASHLSLVDPLSLQCCFAGHEGLEPPTFGFGDRCSAS